MKRLISFILLFIIFCSNIFSQGNIEERIEEGYEKNKENKYFEALKIFNSVIYQNPDIARAYTGRAIARNQLGRIDEAQKDVYKALSLNNKYPEAYYVRGLIFLNEKEYEKALSDFETALSYNPMLTSAKIAIIKTHYKMGDTKKAFRIAEKYSKNDATNGDYYFYMGLILNDQEKYEKALDYFNKAMEMDIDVNPFKIYLYRGDTKLNLNMFMKAKSDFDKAISLNDKNPSVFHGRGVVHYRMDEYEAALEDFNHSLKIIRNNPDKWEINSETYYNRGMTYFRMDKKTEACKNFHRSCELGNKNGCKMVVLKCSNRAQ